MKVVAAVIDNESDLSVEVFTTYQLALASLYEYVKGEWDDSIMDGEEIPTDHYEAVEAYFGNSDPVESYRIAEVEVLDAVAS